MAWMHLVVSLLGGGILLGLGLTKARAVSPTAGYLFAMAGALLPLSACCTTAVFYLAEEGAPDPMMAIQAATVLGSGADLVAMLVVAGAFVVLAKVRTTRADGRAAQP